MLKYCVLLLASLACVSPVSAQMQIADRAPSSGEKQYLSLPAGTPGFLADDFQVGAANEDWVIDHIRLWVTPDPKATSAHAGVLFTKVTLFGGIAPELPTPGEVTCDCHNLPALRTASFQPGAATFNTPGDSLTLARQADGTDVRQIDLNNLKWSVPGATAIQFGLLATPRSGQEGATLYYLGSPSDGGRHLRIFSEAASIKGSLAQNDSGRADIQVWGHLLARVSIRPAGDMLMVTLRGQPALQASQVDPASLRFGPGKAPAENVHVVDTGHEAQPDLVMSFKVADAGIAPKDVNACLKGQRLDGAPFEGCDLLRH